MKVWIGLFKNYLLFRELTHNKMLTVFYIFLFKEINLVFESKISTFESFYH